MSSRPISPLATIPHDIDASSTDLTALIDSHLGDQSEVYAQAVQLLTSMQSSPSCNRLAASTLLTSCQSIEGSNINTEGLLDDLKSVYAAQLAVCELTGAGSSIPQHCGSLMWSEPSTGRQGLRGFLGPRIEKLHGIAGSREIDQKQLNQCLKSLESRPQWWTSYSNSRQNAVVMCQAARIEIEKDDLLNLHKSMVETSSEVNSALSRALQQSKDQLIQQQNFATAVDTFQRQLLRDLRSSELEAQSYLGKLLKSMDSAAQMLLAKMTSSVEDVATGIAALRLNVHKSNDEVVDLEKNIGKVFQRVVEGSSELAASERRQWEVSLSVAVDLQNILETMRGHEINALARAFGTIHNELASTLTAQASNQLMALMYSRQNALDEKLINLDRSFGKLETKAEAFHAAQTHYADTQTRLHEQLQTEMYVARGLLAEVTNSATSLKESVEDASTKIAQMTLFGGITSTILRWGWLSLVIFVIYQFKPKFAGYAAASLGVFLLISTSGAPLWLRSVTYDTILVHHASGFKLPLVIVFKAAAACLMVFGLAVLYNLFSRPLELTATNAFTKLGTMAKLRNRRIYRTWDI
ncbi:Nuclear fusion protein, KAR5 [Lasallia pustulata]|uniref:Nuclear fusion protein, KAR5 n=1 Tax=Lasallia pustulata TaxID=136370 RepID=A0A1W5D242_9LECA|nr:Nuclear fusion protein, KAR5 [Lasallia pustulata]